MVESPQRVLAPGLDGQDESVPGRPAEVAVITPTELGGRTEFGFGRIQEIAARGFIPPLCYV